MFWCAFGSMFLYCDSVWGIGWSSEGRSSSRFWFYPGIWGCSSFPNVSWLYTCTPALRGEHFAVSSAIESYLSSESCRIIPWFWLLNLPSLALKERPPWLTLHPSARRMALLRFLFDFSAILMASLLGIVASSLLAISFNCMVWTISLSLRV